MSSHDSLDIAAQIATNLADVRRRVREAGGGREVEIVAVSKGQPVSMIRAAAQVGLTLFGENYADELVEKATDPVLRDLEIRWTFQGRLQTNKINRLSPHVSLWQSVDSVDRARGLAKRAYGANVLIQINLTGQPQRGGVTPRAVGEVVDASRDAGLNVIGVMGVGPDLDAPGVRPQDCTRAFADAIAIADEHDLAVRSLGMSNDFELAVNAGANMIRIGSLLFGPRTRANGRIHTVDNEEDPDSTGNSD